MDRHIVPGIEAKHAAQAHREDLKIQDEYGCRCMTYWVDEERGSAFCLIDAPNEESVREMHQRAHGLIPHEIVQVNGNVVEAFLGRISDPKGYYDSEDPELKIFNDPAFRIILVAETTDTLLLRYHLGLEKAERLISLFSEIMKKQIKAHEGREIELKDEAYVGSFVSVSQAVDCALAIRKDIHIASEPLGLKIALNAGMPVTKSKELFGDTMKMAKNLCRLNYDDAIVTASIICEIYKDDNSMGTGGKILKSIDPKDENVLQLLMDTLSSNAENHSFGVMEFCSKMSMSKSKLYRKSTELLGMSPNELIREQRLLRSLKFLRTDRNIAQTTFDAGFSSASYFTKCFQERFGLTPLSYQRLL